MDPYKYIRNIEKELHMNDLSKWIKGVELCDDIDVKIIACNILLDIQYNNISSECMKELIEKIINHLHEYRKKYPHSELIDQIKGILEKQEITCKGNHFKPKSSKKLSRVMDWFSIYTRLEKQGNEYINGYIPLNIEELKQKLDDWKKSNRLPLFRGKAPLYWIFKSEELEKYHNKEDIFNISNSCYDSSYNIDFICQKLGIECNKGMYYCQIIFSPHDVEGDFHTPTLFDTMCRSIFRSIKGIWGKTVNISDGEDGIDEAIHKEGNWPDEFEVLRYGMISEDITFQPQQKQKLFNRLQTELRENKIEKFLVRITQFIG